MNNEELQEAKKILKGLKSDNWVEYADDAVNTIYTWQENDSFGYFISEDMLDERVKYEAEEGGVQRLLYFLQGVEKYSPYGYRIDAYGNAETIGKENLIDKLQDIIEDNEE